MAKRKQSTGLKANKKTIYVGDVLKFTVTEDTKDMFHESPLGKILSETGYKSIIITIKKHKWLELDMTAFIEGSNELLAEQGLISHLASGEPKETFDHEYTDVAPRVYYENLEGTTFLRFLLDQNLEITKIANFEDMLARTEDFYLHATQELYMSNLSKEQEVKSLALETSQEEVH